MVGGGFWFLSNFVWLVAGLLVRASHLSVDLRQIFFCNLRQIHLAICDKYIWVSEQFCLACCGVVSKSKSFVREDFGFETNISYNLRQIHLAICDKYI